MYNTPQMIWKEFAQLYSFHICCTKLSEDFRHRSLVLSLRLETMQLIHEKHHRVFVES